MLDVNGASGRATHTHGASHALERTVGAGGSGTGGAGVGGANLAGAPGPQAWEGRNHCLAGWRDDEACGFICTSQTQPDRAACADALDCDIEFDCGPGTCRGSSGDCGVNAIGQGTTPFSSAEEVCDGTCS